MREGQMPVRRSNMTECTHSDVDRNIGIVLDQAKPTVTIRDVCNNCGVVQVRIFEQVFEEEHVEKSCNTRGTND